MADIQKEETNEQVTDSQKAEVQGIAGSASLAQRSFTPEHPAKPSRGRLTKATPELTRAVHNLQTSEDKLDHDIARLNDDKTRLIEQIKVLEADFHGAQAAGLSKATVNRLDSLLIEAQDKLKMLSGIIPETSITRDRATMETILKKWREYDRERTHQAVAENKFHKNPDDKRAEGDINRARAAAFALKEEIGTLVKQGEERVVADTPNPALDEGISYTHEQAVADQKPGAKAPQNVVVPPLEVAQKPEPIAEVPQKQTEVVPLVPEIDLDPVIWEDIHPEIEEGSSQKIDAEPTKDTVPAAVIVPEALDIEPVLREEIPVAQVAEAVAPAAETVMPSDAPAPIETPVPPQVVEPELPKQIIEEEKKVEEVAPTTPETESPIKEPAPQEELPPVAAPEISPIPEQAPVAQTETPSLMPQGFIPSNPQVIAYGDIEVHKHLNILFGTPGVFGFGGKEGVDSPHWKDPIFGFANKTVSDILEAEPTTPPPPGVPDIGIRNRASTTKMQEYIMLALSETGVHPEPGEKAEDYLKRAAAITIDKYMQKEGAQA